MMLEQLYGYLCIPNPKRDHIAENMAEPPGHSPSEHVGNLNHQIFSISGFNSGCNCNCVSTMQLGLQLQPDSLNATSTTTIAQKSSLVP